MMSRSMSPILTWIKLVFNLLYYSKIVDKSKYLKQGVKKGDKGIVIYERAVKNSILVDFSASAHEDKCISVDINDLKRVCLLGKG